MKIPPQPPPEGYKNDGRGAKIHRPAWKGKHAERRKRRGKKKSKPTAIVTNAAINRPT